MSEAPPRVLVVDAANVVGSVPDGWWRDRGAAAARLHAALTRAAAHHELPFDEVFIVLEGKARAGVPQDGYVADATSHPHAPGVRVVHAPASGDDEIVALCTLLTRSAGSVTLASADRGLIARVLPHGVAVIGPRQVPRR